MSILDPTSGAGMFSSTAACRITGATYRQACRWVELGAITPAVPPRGSGSAMRWSHDDVLLLRVLVLLAGIDARHPHSGISISTLGQVAATVDRPLPADGFLVVWPDGVALHFDDLAALRADVAVIVVPLGPVHEHVATRSGRPAAASIASSPEIPSPFAHGGGAVDGAAGTGPSDAGRSLPGRRPASDPLRDEATGADPVALVNTSA